MTARTNNGDLAARSAAHESSLRKVQQRVAAIGFFAVAIHGVLGTIAGAYIVDRDGRHGAAMTFLGLSAAIALLTFGGIRLILQRPLWSPGWIALALVPTAVGVFWLA